MNLGSTSISQAVFETNSESFEQSDLNLFQSSFGLTQQAAIPINTTALLSGCGTTNHSCTEGSLDIQYIMGIAQKSPTYYWYVSSSAGNGDPYYQFLVQVAGTPNPPTSLSISWGSYECLVPSSHISVFNTEALKLTAMGVTILASSGYMRLNFTMLSTVKLTSCALISGDDGVSGSGCYCQYSSGYRSGTGYFPVYPGIYQ